MDWVRSTIELLERLWCRRATLWGLAAAELAAVATWAVVPGELFPEWPRWTICILPALVVPAWLWCRMLPFALAHGKAHVFLALSGDAECAPLIAGLHRQIGMQIRRRSLGGTVQLHALPPNHAVTSHEEARALLGKLGGGVLVYGEYQAGNHGEKRIRGFRRIQFTLQCRLARGLRLTPDGMGATLDGRRFHSDEANSFCEKDLVAENIAEAAVFLVGAGMLMQGNLDGALGVFGELDGCGLSRGPRSRKVLDQSIAISLLSAARGVYEREVEDQVMDPRCNDAANRCLALLKACGSRAGGRSSQWHALMAIIHFHFGRVDDAFAMARAVHARTPSVSTNLSLAFLHLWAEQTERAFAHYTAACQTPCEPAVVMQVVRFLTGVIKMHPEKTQLRWGLAFMNDHFLDEACAIADYEQFLAEARSAYPTLTVYAQNRLEELTEPGRPTGGSSPIQRLLDLAEASAGAGLTADKRVPRSGSGRRKASKRRARKRTRLKTKRP